MKDIFIKDSPIHVPEESVIHDVQVLFNYLRCKGCVGGYRSLYLKIRVKLNRDIETLISRV